MTYTKSEPKLGDLLIPDSVNRPSKRTGIIVCIADGSIAALWAANGRIWSSLYKTDSELHFLAQFFVEG